MRAVRSCKSCPRRRACPREIVSSRSHKVGCYVVAERVCACLFAGTDSLRVELRVLHDKVLVCLRQRGCPAAVGFVATTSNSSRMVQRLRFYCVLHKRELRRRTASNPLVRQYTDAPVLVVEPAAFSAVQSTVLPSTEALSLPRQHFTDVLV